MKRLIHTLLLLCFAVSTVQGQRVGLVLSGGGAKGLYHVGIIKALEENGIPIDYVSGASMGAIVGALYVTGYSPDQMVKFFETDSVQTWLSGKIPEEYRYYFKRFEPTPEMVALRVNPDTTSLAAIKLPTNIISPYRIDLAFLNMLSGASNAAGNNFDDMMVPFRCVASDVFHKKLVVFRDGSLPFAVRASMTIPLVFKPLERDSVLLYDGGVLNNFPWQTLQEDFEPDILIGGVCAGNPANPTQGNIMSQVTAMIMDPTDYEFPDTMDIMIKRRFPEVGTLDYDKAAYIIAKGYEDAMALMPGILAKIERRVSAAEMDRRRAEFRGRITPLVFESVDIEGLTPAQTAYVNRQLGLNLHTVITAEYFEERYMRVLATGLYTADFPEIEYNKLTGFYRLKLRLKTQPSLKVSLGGNISSTSLNQLYLGLEYQRIGNQAAAYSLRGYLGTFYNAVKVGGRHDFFTNFPFYVDYSYNFESFNRGTFNSNPYYRNQKWRFQSDIHNYMASTFALPVFGTAAFRAGARLGVLNTSYFTSFHTAADRADKSQFAYLNFGAEVQTHTMSYPMFAHTGVGQLFSLRYTSGLEAYEQGTVFVQQIENRHARNRSWVEATYNREQYILMRKYFTLGYLVNATVSTQPRFTNQYVTAMTGPMFRPTVLSRTLFMPEYHSRSFVGLGVMPVVNFIDKVFYLKTYAYMYIPQEVFHNNGKWVKTNQLWGQFKMRSEYIFGGSLVYQTAIGPASFTVEKYSTGPKNWHFVLNFGYLLF